MHRVKITIFFNSQCVYLLRSVRGRERPSVWPASVGFVFFLVDRVLQSKATGKSEFYRDLSVTIRFVIVDAVCQNNTNGSNNAFCNIFSKDQS